MARITIFPKLLLTMLLVALIPLAGLAYINTFKAQRDWKANLDVSLSKTADALAAKVNSWTDMNLRVLKEHAALEDIASMDAARQNPVLETVNKTYEWTYLVFTIAPDGQNIGRSDGKPAKFYGDRQYVRQVLDGNQVGQQVLIGKTSGKPSFVLSSPIKDPSGDLKGVIAMAMTLVEMSQAVANVKIGDTGFAILVDDTGKVIAHGKPESITKALQDISNHPALRAGRSGEQVIFQENGRQVLAYPQKLSLGWTLIVQQDYDDAFAPLMEARRDALVLVGVTLTLVIIVALLFARGLVRPIRKLTETADEYSRGKLDAEIPGTGRRDEIGALARAVQRMGVSIKMAMAEFKGKPRQAA